MIRSSIAGAVILSLTTIAAPRCWSAPQMPEAASRVAVSYRLHPEDVLEVTVLGLPQLDKTVTVLPDGTITFPRLDTIRAAGLTPQELKQLLYTGLERYYNNLDITVTVKSLHTEHVTVRGAVKTPGIYELHPGWTIRELLAAAGDLATPNGPPAPDQMRATLTRSTGEQIHLDLAQLVSATGELALPALEPDDVLMVEDLTIQVSVSGEVVQVGTVNLPPGATAFDALRASKGPTEKAALTRAYIQRGAQIIPVNLRPPVTADSTGPPPVSLQRFDTLFVPENKDKFLVWGGVQKPGPYLIPEGETLHLTDALGLAGGPVARAKLKQVGLLQKEAGQYVSSSVDVEAMLKKGDLSRNIVVRPGDILYVPDPKQPTSFNPVSLLQFVPLLF